MQRPNAGREKRNCGRSRDFPAFGFADSGFGCGVSRSRELPGLSARLDKLCYHHGGASLPTDKPHAFVYFITIKNGSDRTVTFLGRKWVVQHSDGSRLVVEGDGIVGEKPRLEPGEQFSYNSYHVTGLDASAQGSFHGVDELGHRVHVVVPAFALSIPRA
ncbi:MAG: magnesium transporter [Opitutia bacterium Tous-C1TDCM]|nr:MAG: magnesium transporter [Opitutae bacterium Tous-C1TDCM]